MTLRPASRLYRAHRLAAVLALTLLLAGPGCKKTDSSTDAGAGHPPTLPPEPEFDSVDRKVLAAVRLAPEILARRPLPGEFPVPPPRPGSTTDQKIGMTQQGWSEVKRRSQMCSVLESRVKLSPGSLEKTLGVFTNTLLARQSTARLDRARALFLQGFPTGDVVPNVLTLLDDGSPNPIPKVRLFLPEKFAAAEKEALAARDELVAPGAGKEPPAKEKSEASQSGDDAASALVLAGYAARWIGEQGGGPKDWERALGYFRAAAGLLDREQDTERSKQVQEEIKSELAARGRER